MTGSCEVIEGTTERPEAGLSRTVIRYISVKLQLKQSGADCCCKLGGVKRGPAAYRGDIPRQIALANRDGVVFATWELQGIVLL